MINLLEGDDNWEIGQRVITLEGSFKDSTGTISHIDQARRRVQVMINVFWRDTPVEFSYDQVKPVDHFN